MKKNPNRGRRKAEPLGDFSSRHSFAGKLQRLFFSSCQTGLLVVLDPSSLKPIPEALVFELFDEFPRLSDTSARWLRAFGALRYGFAGNLAVHSARLVPSIAPVTLLGHAVGAPSSGI